MWHRIEESGISKRRQPSNESRQPSRADGNLINPIGSSAMVPKEATGTDDNTARFIQHKSNVARYNLHSFSLHRDLRFLLIISVDSKMHHSV